MIWLIGPGGAGKTTTGPLLTQRLGLPFRDLDVEFVARFRGIDEFIAAHGYQTYARANVEAYEAVVRAGAQGILALSSGFMTYPREIRPGYAATRHAIARSPTTFVLLPSLDLEACVAETVRRQMARPLPQRPASREESVIRERFAIYVSLPAQKVETMRPPPDVAAEIVVRLRAAPAPAYSTGAGA
ncbi:MAG: shikimate kinase [Gemmatimonadaceae bacterium]